MEALIRAFPPSLTSGDHYVGGSAFSLRQVYPPMQRSDRSASPWDARHLTSIALVMTVLAQLLMLGTHSSERTAITLNRDRKQRFQPGFHASGWPYPAAMSGFVDGEFKGRAPTAVWTR